MIWLDVGMSATNFICKAVLGVDIVLFEVHFDWPVDNDKHVDVQVAHCVREQLNSSIPEVPREYSKHDAENEEEVNNLSATVSDFACTRNFLISQADAAHSHGNHELNIVEDEEAECDDDGPKVGINLSLTSDLIENAV